MAKHWDSFLSYCTNVGTTTRQGTILPWPPWGSTNATPQKTKKPGTRRLKTFLKREKKVRIPDPHDWDRDRKHLDTFFQECKAWIVDCDLDNNEDDAIQTKAIMMITGHMKGLAAQWFMTQMKIHRVNVGEIWESWKAFWMDLKARFGDSDPNFLARTRLQKLKQGDKSVHYYNSQFNEHMGLTGYNETALVNQYFSGLDSRILEGIFVRDYIPEDLKGNQSATIWVENLWERLGQFTSRSKWKDFGSRTPTANKGQPKPNLSPNVPTPPTPAHPAMGPGTTGPMDIDRARKEGLCRYCREQYMPGHMCTLKKVAQDAYCIWNRAMESTGKASKDADFDQGEGTSQALVKKGKGKEKALSPDPNIGGTLATLMDAVNILGKRLDSLNGWGFPGGLPPRRPTMYLYDTIKLLKVQRRLLERSAAGH